MYIPASLSENPIYLAGELSHQFSLRITAAFRSAGVEASLEQFSILAQLLYQEGQNQQDLANALHRDKTTIARVVNRMVRDGLLIRRTDSTDLRSKQLFLTPKGRQTQEQMVEITSRFFFELTQDLPEESIREGCRILETMLERVLKTGG